MRKLSIVLTLVIVAFAISLAQAQDSAQQGGTPLKIAFVSNQNGNDDIFIIPDDGSRPPVNLTSDSRAQDNSPTWSPDGATIAFTSDRGGFTQIWLMDQNGNQLRRLIQDGVDANEYSPAYAPDGDRLVFVSDRAGIGLDLYVYTQSTRVVERVTTTGRIKGDPVFSPDGREIVYWERQVEGDIHLFRLTLDTGALVRLTTRGQNNGMAAWTPDGSAILFESDRDGAWGIYTMQPNGNSPLRLTAPDVNSGRAAISPDGTRLIFVSDRDESDELYRMNIDGSDVERLTENLYADFMPAWQPVVPVEVAQIIVDTTLLATPTPAPVQGIAMGQSVNNIQVSPISLDTMLVDYGIRPWQQSGWTGSGVRVGILDTGFGNLSAVQTRLGIEVNLPPDAQIADYSGDLNDHGSLVVSVIHAVAPDADLYVCRYRGIYEEFSLCVEWLVAQDVRIINHSAGVPALPLDGQSNEWAILANDVYRRNVLWVNSAGNFAQGFRAETYLDRDGDKIHDFVTGETASPFIRIESIGDGYRGNIILSWTRTGINEINPDGTFTSTQVDFDLEIIDLFTGEVIASSNREQRLNSEMTQIEFVYLNTSEPFAIRIVNRNTTPVDSAVQMLLFGEYLQFPEPETQGSVIAPADARFVLTTGAVQGLTNNLAVYSSRGVRGTDAWTKPDLSAPGELILDDGTLFVGTSAAAPVVAGAAALLIESDPSQYRINEFIRDALLDFVSPAPSLAYGSGILSLPAPTGVDLSEGIAVADVQPKVTFPQPETVIVENTIPVCSGAVPVRVAVGARAYTVFNLGLALRTEPSRDAATLVQLQVGDEFEVINGPECNAALNWWQVQLDDGSIGWVGEGSDYYLISPVNLELAIVPDTTEECPGAPETQLEVGARAVTTDTLPPGGLTFWRERTGNYTIGGVGPGVEVQVIGGPYCSETSAIRRWFVRALNGEFANQEGVMSEAQPGGDRWLRRVS